MSDSNEPAWEDDDADLDLLARLRRLAADHDPVPAEAVAAARSAIAWRTLDAELAELTADSSAEARPAGVRAADDRRLLTFEAASLTIEMEALESAGARRVLGQLVPAQAAEVVVRHAGGTVTAQADGMGRFRVDGVAPGPVSLRCAGDAGVVETDWFLL